MSELKRKRTLLTGPAGCGKTRHCIRIFAEYLERIKSPDDHTELFYILPSREHADRIESMLLRESGRPGFFGNRIMTLSDFIRLKATQKPGRLLTGMERQWIVGNILKRNSWQWWDETKKSSGLAAVLTDWIGKIRSCGIPAPTVIRKLTEAECGRRRQRKYRDLSRLLMLYTDVLTEAQVYDQEELILDFIAADMPAAEVAENSLLIIDGFYRFNGLQQLFISSISHQFSETVLTLTLKDELKLPVFELTQKTRVSFLNSGFKEVKQDFGERHRFCKTEYLLEPSASVMGAADPPVLSLPEGICYEAAGFNDEIELIGRLIIQEVRAHTSYYSDHMIVVRDMARYKPLIESVMRRFQIPYNIHERLRLSDYPKHAFFIEWIRLAVLTDEGWKINCKLLSVFLERFFPSDFLENDRLKKELSDASEQELLDLTNGWSGFSSGSCCEILKSLASRPFISDADHFVRFCTSDLTELFALSESDAVIDEVAESYFLQFVRMTALLLQKKEVGASDVFERLRVDLETGLYSGKEPSKNRVQVYDTVLAMPKEYRNVYIVGLSDGIFPPNLKPDPVFDDTDIELLLPHTDILKQSDYEAGEYYFFYMSATRASEKTIFTRPEKDENGNAMMPSPFFDFTQKSFGMSEKLPMPQSPYDLLSECFKAGTADNYRPYLDALKVLGTDEIKMADFLLTKLSAYSSGFAITEKTMLNRMTDDRKSFSPTELSRLHDCSYKHFAEYLLRLKEDVKSIYLDEGNFLHACMELWVQECFISPDSEADDARAVADRIFHEQTDQFGLQGESYFETHEMQKRLRLWFFKAVDRYLKSMETRRGYSTYGCELSFGRDSEPVFIDGGDAGRICVHGKIDRIDVDADGANALVVDYKRGGVPSRADIRNGKSPQAPVYLAAAEAITGHQPKGIEFSSFSKSKGFSMKKCGSDTLSDIKSEKAYDEVMAEACTHIAQDVRRVRAAEIDPVPAAKGACSSCSYVSMCRFSGWKFYR